MSTGCIPKDRCLGRRLYRIRSRNLRFGVYNPETGGFLGIRQKFESRYVFEEYHWDNGPPFGTVRPLEDLGIDLPESILLRERLPGSWDQTGTRKVEWRPDDPEGKVGKWFFEDTGEETSGGFIKENPLLFAWLTAQEREFEK